VNFARDQTCHSDFGCRNLEAVERRVITYWKSVRTSIWTGSDWCQGVTYIISDHGPKPPVTARFID